MEVLPTETKFAHLGKPGTVFSKGFARRLSMITRELDLSGKKILDAGAGEGVWLDQFAKLTEPKNVFGSDIDPELVAEARQDSLIPSENIVVSAAESLPWEEGFFDVVFSNEVLEHVEDDRQAVEETFRVLKPGGSFVIFTPNRGWPFETHGMFLRGKYYWGNIPFLPWMPKRIYTRLAPHVRNYSNRRVRKLLIEAGFEIVHHRHVFPGFDGLVRKAGIIGQLIQKIFHFLERTPLHFFGISHFIIARKPVST